MPTAKSCRSRPAPLRYERCARMARARPTSAAWLAWREAVAGDLSAWQCALGGMMARRRRSAGKPRGKRVARARTANARAVEATLADIAHEVRTPLTGILALGELLATSELGARERDWATAIKSTAEHLALLTSLIVDAGRADAKGLEHGADISTTLPEAVIGDALRLRAALENLIDNAVKFTERGSVRLEAAGERGARGKVRLVFTVT